MERGTVNPKVEGSNPSIGAILLPLSIDKLKDNSSTMSGVSDDGFWKFENGSWVATEKQKQALASGAAEFAPPAIQPSAIPGDSQGNIQFVPVQQTMTENEVSTNQTANEGYVQLSGLTTTRTHTSAAKKFLGNPFYQSVFSRTVFDSIQEPGEKKMKQTLLNMHNVVENTARSKFNSGDMSHNAEQIISKMYLEGEEVTHKWPLQIRKVEVMAPSDQAKDGFTSMEKNDHFGVRGILTSERILLIDSTEDSVTQLTNPINQNPKLPLQRKQSGIFEISHKIMHDFWFKSISLSDISGSEFHFSHFSNSSKKIRRFHHFASIIVLLFSVLFVGISIISLVFSDDGLLSFFIFNIAAMFLGLIAYAIYYYASTMKQYLTHSSYGKERILKIGYFDKIHNKHLVLKLQLEDSQTIDKTIDWIRLLESSYNKIE